MATKRNVMEEYGISMIVNYLRKSRQDEEREKKTGEDTLHEQKLLMDRALADYGIPYDQRPEIGSGDKISTRPVFQQIVKDLENGKYHAIAVKEISRLGRGSYTDMGLIYDLLVEKRIYIITPWKIYDPTNPSDMRQIRFELFLSREEFETTRERLTGGRYNAAMEGKWVAGAAPFGYDYNPKTKRLIINEKEAEIVRAIFDYYANGIVDKDGNRKLVQFRALSTFLQRIGIKTQKGKDHWHPVSLRQFLQSERYIGTIRYNTMQTLSNGKRVKRPTDEHIIVENAHPAIVDIELWEKAQKRIDSRDTTNVKLDFEASELAGLCICKVCNLKMIRQYSVQHYKKQDGTTSKYEKEFLWCTKIGCTFVKYRSVEEDLLKTLEYLQDLEKEALEKLVNKMVIKQKNTPKNHVEELKNRIKSRHIELDRRMTFVYEKYESGIYTDDMFLQRKKEIDKEMEELNKVNVWDNVDETETINAEELKVNITSLLAAYHKATSTSQKNKLLRSVFDHVEIEVLQKGRGRRPAIHEITPYLKSAFTTTQKS